MVDIEQLSREDFIKTYDFGGDMESVLKVLEQVKDGTRTVRNGMLTLAYMAATGEIALDMSVEDMSSAIQTLGFKKE